MKEVGELRHRLEEQRELWDAALVDLTRANYERWLGGPSAWAPRLRPAALRRLPAPARRALVTELVNALWDAVDQQPEARARLEGLSERSDAAATPPTA